jgi:hypothetical protein
MGAFEDSIYTDEVVDKKLSRFGELTELEVGLGLDETRLGI